MTTIVWVPWVSVLLVYVAEPLLFSATVASVLVPSRNTTVPVGVPRSLLLLTVAVKITLSPRTAGLSDEATTVAKLINSTSMLPALYATVGSNPYWPLLTSVTVVNCPTVLPKSAIPTAVPHVLRPATSKTSVEVPPKVSVPVPRLS